MRHIPIGNRNCPQCGSPNIKQSKGERVCSECGFVLDKTLGPQAGTPGHIYNPAYTHGGDYSPQEAEAWADFLKVQEYMKNSFDKGHNYSIIGRKGKNLYACNRCFLAFHSVGEMKTHLEEKHNYEIHPERRPQPEPPFSGHMICLEKGVWQCIHCGYENRENKVVWHLAKAHKLQYEISENQS